jgi:hypothetical protein
MEPLSADLFSPLLLAFFLWMLLRGLDRVNRPHYPCRLCSLWVHWNGNDFVHDNGQRTMPDDPPLEGFNDQPMTHPALPAR